MNLQINTYDIPLARRLKFHKSYWCSITKDKRCLDLVKGFKFEFIKKPHQSHYPRPIKLNKEEHKIMEEKIQELLENKSITKIPGLHPDGFVSNVFLVCKRSSGQHHFICDLSVLNLFRKKIRFKLNGITSLLNLLTPQMYLASLDISSSFSHINILESSRKFTQFKFGGQWYHMNCVAQGGMNSPEIFCYLR